MGQASRRRGIPSEHGPSHLRHDGQAHAMSLRRKPQSGLASKRRKGEQSPSRDRFDRYHAQCAAPVSQYTWQERLGDDAYGILLGMGIGIALLFALFVDFAAFPMLVRRYAVTLRSKTEASQVSTETPDGTPIPVTGTSIRLPQIKWDLILTDEEVANRNAMREDVMSMRDVSPSNILAWPVLPYPVGSWYGDDRFLNLARMTNWVYSDEPELSVYTNGQNLSTCSAFSAYRLVDAEGDTNEENCKEYEEVLAAADALHAEIESDMAVNYPNSGTLGCDSDEMYVLLLYKKLGTRTTYSDDVDDTKHANDIYGALIEDESKCYGVACATKALLNRRGIPSFLASGSADGNENCRHAWVTMWLDGQWKIVDVTSAQGQEPPEIVDLASATSGSDDYWEGCMKSFDEFVESWNMDVDEDDLRLMRAYEKSIGVAPESMAESEDMGS